MFGFAFFGFWDGSDKFGLPSRRDDFLRRLTRFVEFPVLTGIVVRGIDNGFFEKEMGHPSQCQTLHNWLYINTNL